MPAAAATAAILLYSSAARLTSSSVGVFPPPSVAVIICVMPISLAQSMDAACFSLSSFMLKCALSHVRPWSPRISLTILASDRLVNSV